MMHQVKVDFFTKKIKKINHTPQDVMDTYIFYNKRAKMGQS